MIPVDFWEDFTTIGRSHGYDHRLGATPKEYMHLVRLTDAYTAEELHAMAVAYWATPYLPQNRNLGLFASNAGALFKLVKETPWQPFGVPQRPQASASRVPVATAERPTACAHEPRCETRAGCRTLTAIQGMEA